MMAMLIMTFHPSGFSQKAATVSGRITGADNKAPLAKASVFISNSTRGTSANDEGFYELSNIPAGRHNLIISAVGYNSITFSFSSDDLPLKKDFALEPKVQQLAGITVQSFDKNGWDRWGDLFQANFLGQSTIAREAKIVNPDVLRFRYTKNSVLEVYANETLLIESPGLGYRIKYDLQRFSYDSANHQLFLEGNPYFEDLADSTNKKTKRWKRNRRQVYEGSKMHFMRSLFSQSLDKEGFEVYPTIGKGNGYYDVQHDKIKDSLLVTSGININSKSLRFSDYLTIIYRKAKSDSYYANPTSGKGGGWTQQSLINLRTSNPVMIYFNGSYAPPLGLYINGYWAWSEKIGQLLPLDYVPEK
jgi:hypothetical protein